MALQGRVKIDIVFDTYSVALDLGSRSAPLIYTFQKAITEGSGANQCTTLFSDSRTLAASANEDLDLSGTALQSMLNANLALTAVKLLYVEADAGNTNNVLVKPAASNGWLGPFANASDIIAIPPGQAVPWVNFTAAGWPVTAGTGDLLNIANSGGTTGVTYKIIIAGI
jgi:hypothetical protein